MIKFMELIAVAALAFAVGLVIAPFVPFAFAYVAAAEHAEED